MTTADALRRPATRTSLSREHLAAPPRTDRPGIRWWWQTPLPVGELLDELRAIAAAGFGEVEIAFSPGFWADAAQREALAAVLAEARRLEIGVAMTLGAAWPLQTPNTARGTRHAAQELQYGATRVEVGDVVGGAGAPGGAGPGGVARIPVPTPFDDPQLERGGELVAVVAARVLERGTPPRVVDSGNPWGKPTKIIEPERSTLIDQDTLTVLEVEGEGAGAVVTRTPGQGQWVLTAFWTRDAEQGVTSFLDADAARAALDYLDAHQIGGAAGALAAEGSTATELFEDSLELNADCLFWSPTLLERFRDLRGYDPTPYLPLLMVHGQCRYWVPDSPVTPDFTPATADGAVTDLGARVRADYERTLTDLYVSDHLALIQDWAVGHGMRHKAQAAYGQNLEPVRSFRELVRRGGRAEIESLNSGDRIPMGMDRPTWRFSVDWQRSCAAGAHQGGAVRVSTELGAQMDKCYDFSLTDYRHMLDKEWALGATKPFVHGYAAQEADAPWPTRGRFGTIVSESWNHRRFPQWAHWRALTDYWARGTAVLETGAPRCDVAVHRDGFLTTAARGDAEADATAPHRLIDAEALERAGFGVQILDPVGLAEGALGVDDAGATVLYPDGPAYRALILDGASLPPDAARALARAAGAGLAVVVVGEPPAADTGWGGAERSEEVRAALARALAGARAVRVDGWDEIPAALAGLGVRPRAGWSGPVLLSQVRDADEGRYVLVYNPSEHETAAVDLDVEGEGPVEVLDLDTGAVLPVTAERGGGRTRVKTALAPLGLVVLRVLTGAGAGAADGGADAAAGAGAADGGAAGGGSGAARRVRVAGAVVGPEATGTIGPAGSAETAGPDGVAGHVESVGPASETGREPALEDWSLTVISEEPGGPREIPLPGQGPADWRDIDELRTVSGTGIYRVRVTRGSDPAALAGAELVLGEIGGSAVVRAGGRDIATVLRPDAVVPLGGALAEAVAAGDEPVIEIEVRTTLRNATLAADVYTQGPWAVEHPTRPHGLLGPVRLIPGPRGRGAVPPPTP